MSVMLFVVFSFLFIYPQKTIAQQVEIPSSILSTISNFDQASQQKIIQQLLKIPASTLETMAGMDEKQQMEIFKKLLEFQTKTNISNTKAYTADLTIKTNPIYPQANEETTATIVSNLTDINRANIFWYINDKLVSSGIGLDKINFFTKDVGKSTVIDVVLKTQNGLRIDKRLVITPANLDILWEADSYTPPFYKGKALLSPKTTEKIVAIPNFVTPAGRTIPATELIYIWREDGRVIKDKSGYGKNVIYMEAPLLFWEKKISVEVSSFGKSINAYKSIKPKITLPMVAIYEDMPTEGVWYSSALKNNVNLSDKELALKAEPYFFSKNDIALDNLIYNWSLNEKPVSGEKNRVILRQEGGGGDASVGINIKNIGKSFQSAKDSFVLNFKGVGSFNF